MLPTTMQPKPKALPAATHVATFLGARLHVATEYQSDCRYQAVELSWSIEGSSKPFVERFVRVTLHPKGTLYNRISALIGRDLTEDDVIDWIVADDAQVDAQVDVYDRDTLEVMDTEDTGVVGELDDLTVNGSTVLGLPCLLKLTISGNGYNRCDSSGASPLPKRMSREPSRSPLPSNVENTPADLPF